MAPPRILSIAGSDSSGGAGIQADIKTITMLGGYAMTAITAITAQNSLGVTAVQALSANMVAAQVDACVSDIGVDAVKIGMLGSPEIAAVVADRLEALAVPVVFDPVMIATSGAALADDATIAGFERLMRLAVLTTPNVTELAALGGHEAMVARGVAYLAKGGDAEGERVEDTLMIPERHRMSWPEPASIPATTTAPAAPCPAPLRPIWAGDWRYRKRLTARACSSAPPCAPRRDSARGTDQWATTKRAADQQSSS